MPELEGGEPMSFGEGSLHARVAELIADKEELGIEEG